MARSNLARQAAPDYPQRRAEEQSRPTKVNLAPVSEKDRDRRLRAQEIVKANRRNQIKFFVAMVAMVLTLTGVMGFLLGQQTKLVEINFSNAEIEKQIDRLKIENVQQNSELIAETDLDRIRARALELGMQDPIASQIVYLDVPVQDRLILGHQSSQLEASEEREGNALLANIEAFFKSFLP